MVKTLLFLRTILTMDPDNVIYKIFNIRLRMYCNHPVSASITVHRSRIFDILNICHKFGLFTKIEKMANVIEKVMG